MPINQNELAQYYGTEDYHRFGLSPRVVLTDGALYVAKNGGTNGAFWLMDAIASYQPQLLKKETFREYQFWKLEVKDGNKAVLTCRADADVKPEVTQEIEYTDFDLPSIELWVEPMGDGSTYVILLPQEH